MILIKNALVYITTRNIGNFRKFGLDPEPWTTIVVPIECLSKGSNTQINCACDECKKEKWINYSQYIKYTEKNKGKYYCRQCAQKILEENNLLNTGFKFPAQNPDVLNKMKISLETNHKVSNPGFLRKNKNSTKL